MKVNVKKKGSYVPRWRGNKELPEKEQVKFHYRFLTNDERDDYIYLKPVTLKKINDGDGLDREYVQDGKGIAKAVTTSIENLTAVENGKEKEIKTVEEFYKYSFPLLTAEYETHLLTVSQVDEDPNGERPSGSS